LTRSWLRIHTVTSKEACSALWLFLLYNNSRSLLVGGLQSTTPRRQQCPAAYQVAVAVIDLLQPIQVQQQNSKRPSRAPRSFDLRTEDV